MTRERWKGVEGRGEKNEKRIKGNGGFQSPIPSHYPRSHFDSSRFLPARAANS